ncbi:MAG: hypothetical protein VX610_09445, partial [SAR324 cluster bacterium]|nr:hypothetical protein [SAR324 cluster bacterium]
WISATKGTKSRSVFRAAPRVLGGSRIGTAFAVGVQDAGTCGQPQAFRKKITPKRIGSLGGCHRPLQTAQRHGSCGSRNLGNLRNLRTSPATDQPPPATENQKADTPQAGAHRLQKESEK